MMPITNQSFPVLELVKNKSRDTLFIYKFVYEVSKKIDPNSSTFEP